MSVVVDTYQELQDISLQQFGTAEGLVALAKLNGLGLDGAIASGQVLSVPVFTAPVSDPDLLKPYIAPQLLEDSELLIYQSLTDLAVQEYGNASALVALCKLNGFALDAEVAYGTEVQIGTAVRNSMKQYLRDRNKKVVTDAPVDAGGEVGMFILAEDGSYIAAEDGSGILLE